MNNTSNGLRHPLADCLNCPLNEPERKFVPSVGNESASVVLVGEIPGYQDVKTGVPFSGPAGKLLDTVLSTINLNRNETFITNVCLCQTADMKAPSKQAIACCAPRLEAEIKARKPDTIVALGNTAASAIMGEKVAITKLRQGGAKTSRLYPDVAIVPTFHPAYILRVGDMFPHLVEDIKKVQINANLVRWEPPRYAIFDEPERAKLAIRELDRRNDRLFVIDIEVGLDKETDFDHPNHYKLLCLGIGYAPHKVAVFGKKALSNNDVKASLKRLFEHSRIVAHNGKFDLKGLRPTLGKIPLWFDTMLASYLTDERRGTNGLKYLAQELLGAPEYEQEIKQYVSGKNSSYENIPEELLYKYNAYDVSCTYDLYEYYKDRLEKEGLRKTHDFLVAASNTLTECELNGIQVDTEYLEELSREYQTKLGDLEKILYKWVDNPRSPLQVKKALQSLGFDVDSTAEEILRTIEGKAKGDAKTFVENLLTYRRTAKLHGTYIKGIDERLYRGRVHPTFLLHGTTTGRLACRNPNMQNVPRESSIRRLFVPEPGFVFVQADYAAIELRVVATLAHDRYLKDVFTSGRDLHSEVAAKFYGENFTKDQRVRAKAFVFGLVYGREAYSIAQEYKIPVNEAQKNMQEFFAMIPDVVAWREEIRDTILHRQDDLVSPFGRHRRFWVISDENKSEIVKEALAFLPQSTASDINLSSLIRLEKEGFHVLLPVHDSILVQAKEDEAEDVAKRMVEVMETTATEVFSDYVPFKAEVNIGKNWSEV